MVRQLPPPHLKTAGPTAPPPHRFTSNTVVENHFTGADKLIPSIPGFRTSAAFLTSLSANLRITDDDLMPSPLLTPNTFRDTNFPLRSPSPFSFSTVSSSYPYPSPAESTMSSTSNNCVAHSAPALDTLPELHTHTASTAEERIEGLRLIADSVAQQRQIASKALIFHPLHLALYFLVASLIIRYFYTSSSDWPVIITTLGGFTMAALVGVRYATGGYIALAENVGWEWLKEDRLVVVRWGEEVIGALVLGWETPSLEEGTLKKKNGRGKGRKGYAVVRAWTVKLKYRGKGIGEGLLEEAVRVASTEGAEGVKFADEHATAERVLPEFYNAFLNKRDCRAEIALEKVAREKGNFGRRRYSPSHGSR
ncbi:hypothetical protein GQ43DRAFT_416197 [Delitschia confertaspora ATCC 74209]|uniref:N-acetyltransferase domain-containing protein n=1 Tax=Delitschia confertaspora ATCC 74209 TaxID=1513339 RepID=A0A9P4MVK9_9PLEO|nr:hypothetical protein GQ43DRAFT_416197 [Delitschia confertaspora ATCC 74209]